MTAISKLGTLLLYRIPTGMYSRESIEKAMKEAGLTIESTTRDGTKVHTVPHMPTVPSNQDAFRTGCRVALKPYANMKDNQGRKVKVRLTDVPTSHGSGMIQRDVVQEIVGAKQSHHFDAHSGSKLSQNSIEESIAKILWKERAPAGSQFEIRMTVPMERAIKEEFWAPGINYVQMFEEMERQVKECKQYVNDVQMRAFVKEMITLTLGGRKFSEVRGTYFVRAEYEEKAKKFELALRKMVNRDGKSPYAQTVTLYDEGTVREDMKRYFNDELEAEIRDMIDEINVDTGMRVDKQRRVSAEIKRYEKIIAMYDDTVDKERMQTLLELAANKFGISMQQYEVTKKASEAAREAKKIKKEDSEGRPDEKPEKTQFRKPKKKDQEDRPDKVAQRKQKGMFSGKGNKSKKAKQNV